MQRALRATAKTNWQTPLFKILDPPKMADPLLNSRPLAGGARGAGGVRPLIRILIKRADDWTLTYFLQGFGQVWDRFGQVWAGLALVFV